MSAGHVESVPFVLTTNDTLLFLLYFEEAVLFLGTVYLYAEGGDRADFETVFVLNEELLGDCAFLGESAPGPKVEQLDGGEYPLVELMSSI